MLVFIVLYAYATFIWTLYKMSEGFIDEKPQPVLVALTYMLFWPPITVGYICVGIKMFARHMIREFTGGRGDGKNVYIAGPMRGYPLFNFPAFDSAAAMLREMGWEVFSPAEHDRASGFDASLGLDMQPDFEVTEAFRWDVATILNVDAVYFLDGWEASQGANTEHAIAVSIGIERMYQTPRDEHVYYYLPHVAFVRPRGARIQGKVIK